MSKYDKPGYPLPDGELGNDELACTIVYYPDRPEYRQALVNSLLFLGNWLAWERDEDKRGTDAAADWKLANDLSLECLYMSCFEELQSDVSDILDHLRNTVPCCGDIVIYGDSTVYVTTIIPGVGDDPSHYGETEVTDWDEWSEYLCYNAHKWVDELAKQSNQLELALSVGGMSLGLAGFIVAAIVLFVVGGFLSGVIIMAIVSGVIAGYTANMFSDAADDIDAARTAIVCAIMNGTDVAQAVEDALGSGLAWDLFFSQLDYDTPVAILYEGGDGVTYLEAEKRDDCDCVAPIGEFQILTDFETGTWEGWGHTTTKSAISNEDPIGNYGVKLTSENFPAPGSVHLTFSQLLDLAGVTPNDSGTIYLHRVTFWYKMTNGAPGLAVLRNFHDSGDEANTWPWSDDYVKADLIFDPPLESTYNEANVVKIAAQSFDGYILWVDNITVDFDHIPA